MTDPARFDTYLQVRLTTHDKERIKARALEAGLKTSEYVRKRALGERMRGNKARAVCADEVRGVLNPGAQGLGFIPQRP